MKQSLIFTKTQKEAPAGEEAKNAQLLIRAGYVHKEMAGVYTLLPFGLMAVEKIKKIVREEMNTLGAIEIITTSLQKKELWERTGRWSDAVVDVWFKSKLKSGGAVGFAWSHEEPITDMLKNHISSYKDLPIYVYQFQNKLRNEKRVKSGIMRGREFLMKDMYSYSADEKSHLDFYEKTKVAYMKAFERIGIGDDTFITYATGGAFTAFSHEFQTICETGEDITFINKEKGIAINEEVLNEDTLKSLDVVREELTKTKTAEVGNIFNFGQEKAHDVGLMFNNEKGSKDTVWIGSYGIGITRVLGVIVEKFADDKGIVLPKSIAPYQMHLVGLNGDESEIKDWTDGVYTSLQKRGIEVLYDDRDARPGQKFADSDLLGMPYRVIVSKKTKEKGKFEVIERSTGDVTYVSEEELYQKFE